jgi:DNA-binding transcriptional MerR regulator
VLQGLSRSDRDTAGIDRNGDHWNNSAVPSQAVAEAHEPGALTVDELATRAAVPVRTIREYQTLGLLPPPARRGRIGVYGPGHVARLELIGRLQARGYSLAGIRDLLLAWRDGGDLGEVLGLDADQLVHFDEPGARATSEQLQRVLPGVVPQRLDDLLSTGVVEASPDGTYCVPSPSLLQLAADALRLGYPPDVVLRLLGTLGQAAEAVAAAAAAAVAERPNDAEPDELVAFATRARGLLAHGTGRLAIHALGKRLGITDESSFAEALQQLMRTRG